jgi:FkbM family methyltransferase
MDYSECTLQMGDVRRPFYFRPGTSDDGVIQQVFRDQHYTLARLKRAAELMAFIERRKQRGKRPLIVDAGANIGASAAYFALTFAGSRVVAIEPSVENFELLTKNCAGLEVHPVLAAVASAPGKVRIVDSGSGFWALRTESVADPDGDGVPCVTVAEVCAAHANECFPFMVKVDIEGGEKDLFSTNTDWVASTPLIIIELHDWLFPKAGSASPFLRTIAALDRDFICVGENVFSIANDLDSMD